MESENPFERFISETKKYANMWDTIEMKIVAIKGDNTYYLLGMHATLLANAIPVSEILLDLEDVIMLHEVKSVTHTELYDVIKGLENGIVKIGERELKLKDFGRFDFGRSHGHRRGPLDVGWDWPYFWLRAIGSKSVRELINEKEINTKLNKWGYEELYIACEENLGFRVGGAYSPHIYLIAPIYIIANAQFKEDKLIFSVKCHRSVRPKDVSISYGIEGDAPKHDRIKFTTDDMVSQQEDFNELQKIIDLPSGTKSIRFWTFYKDEEIDKNWRPKPVEKIEEINPKLVAIESLFSKRERGELIEGKRIFERNLGLETKVPDEKAFESAVLNLMSIAGFEVIFAGKGFDAQGIDILAFSPNSSDVIVISCTIGNNIGEKIRTLLPQINKLKNQLENYELIPTIFSPIKPEDIVYSDKMNACEHKVSLLLSDDIRKIYQTIQTTPVSKIKDVVLDYIKSRIPTEI